MENTKFFAQPLNFQSDSTGTLFYTIRTVTCPVFPVLFEAMFSLSPYHACWLAASNLYNANLCKLYRYYKFAAVGIYQHDTSLC
jgi:hypothetical protein